MLASRPHASAGALGGNPDSRDPAGSTQTLALRGSFRISVLSVNIVNWEPVVGKVEKHLPA